MRSAATLLDIPATDILYNNPYENMESADARLNAQSR